MTTLSCDLCNHETEGNTFEEWMQNLLPHYMKVHADVMNDPNKGEKNKETWMTENRARFDAAQSI